VPYPQDALSYLANVFNAKARAFYAKHGVKLIDAAYEANEERGDGLADDHQTLPALQLQPVPEGSERHPPRPDAARQRQRER
jgi:hypothetical protein